MTVDPAILETFFEECEDLLVSLTDGIAALRADTADDDTLNAIFRAVHSIKGAAGAFGFNDLVSFAHRFETILERLRNGDLAADAALLGVLQRSGDILAELVEAARDDTVVATARIDPVLADLDTYVDDAQSEQDFAFEPLALDLPGPAPVSENRFDITFAPNRQFFATGNDSIAIIKALEDLGACNVTVDSTDLPDNFAGFSWEEGLLRWEIQVTGAVEIDQIEAVFAFTHDLCALKISSAKAPETAAEIDVAVPVMMGDADSPPRIEPPKTRPAASLRVAPERIDRLINAVGELIINQSVISQRIEEAGLPGSDALHADLDDYKLLAREIQEGVMAIRAQPVKSLFQRMQRIGRDAADATGKSIEVLINGEETEVDKTVIERLADPLTHMVRNAIDHGIETPTIRAAAGKSQIGTLALRAAQRSGSIVIEIADDGAGLNRERIRKTALKRRIIGPNDQLAEQEIDQLLFAPGFSTADEVTNLSGRGVGMDVVKTAITDLGGRIAIGSIAGEGTTFTITLPLTLAVMDGMVVGAGGQTMVLPISSILESVRPSHDNLVSYGLNETLLRIRGEHVPIIELAEVLGGTSGRAPLMERVLLLVQTDAVPLCALAVDQIHDQRQIVVKSLRENYGEINGVSGATILGDGKIALIIDPDTIAKTVPRATPVAPAQRSYAHAVS